MLRVMLAGAWVPPGQRRPGAARHVLAQRGHVLGGALAAPALWRCSCVASFRPHSAERAAQPALVVVCRLLVRPAQVMTQGGPWHARRLVSGDAFMGSLRTLWLARLEGDWRRGAAAAAAASPVDAPGARPHQQQPLSHVAQARVLVMRRDGDGSDRAARL